MNKWISVNDDLPDDLDRVLYWDGRRVGIDRITLRSFSRPKDKFLVPWAKRWVTHWMPIPDAPVPLNRAHDEQEDRE